MARHRQPAAGAFVLTMAAALATGFLCIRLVWEYADWYEYLSLPPFAAPFRLLALCYGLQWLLLGIGTGIALAVPAHPWEQGTILWLYLSCMMVSLLLPVCLLRWELPNIAFALATLLLPLCSFLISAAARANRAAGFLLFPLFVFAGYQGYLLLGICLLR